MLSESVQSHFTTDGQSVRLGVKPQRMHLKCSNSETERTQLSIFFPNQRLDGELGSVICSLSVCLDIPTL
jgi:hypothetical protein